MIRSFIAIDLDPEIAAKIALATRELAPLITGIRWVDQGNFHLTLKFLGHIDEGLIAPISEALVHALNLFPCCRISAKGLGVFPDSRRPRILWVGMESKALLNLAAGVETALMPLGFAKETRGFQPHLTIGRWRQPDRHLRQLSGVLERWQDYEFGSFSVGEVKLYRSQLTPERAIYSNLTTIKLAAA